MNELNNCNLLIVEDEPINRLILEKMLKKHFSVKSAPDAGTALNLLNRYRFDIILMDINLGVSSMDGTELMKLVKCNPRHQNTIVFAVTSYALPKDREFFLKTGFDAYHAKPIDKETLLKEIIEVLKIKVA